MRYLVGTAVLVAAGLLAEETFHAALDAQVTVAGLRAPAFALTLWEVCYPAALDPFVEDERLTAPGVPSGLPFTKEA